MPVDEEADFPGQPDVQGHRALAQGFFAVLAKFGVLAETVAIEGGPAQQIDAFLLRAVAEQVLTIRKRNPGVDGLDIAVLETQSQSFVFGARTDDLAAEVSVQVKRVVLVTALNRDQRKIKQLFV